MGKSVDNIILETDRLILRKFELKDMEALFLLLNDKDVNTFLPWYPVKNLEQAEAFYKKRIADKKYYFAICMKQDNIPVGYVNAETDDSHDFGYAICKEFWHKGIATEASKALVEYLKKDGMLYITATQDRNNPRSGGVMRNIGMKYCYSYEEQWQPKNFPVIFRMYQLNLDGREDRVYRKYWNIYDRHFVEEDV